MRILKRNLAFVLALVMALSLTVSAMGVEDYSDVNEIAFVEAVDVMTEMGILEGTNGVFNPEKVLNRAEAAKIIAYMLLGKNAADNLQAVTAPFADVPAKHWAAGYIAHCVNEGIINGVSATEYNPNGELTATAFAKMLLSAVGYNVNGEFTGARWETEVNALALKLGVFDDNLGAELGAGCTREEAALYAFNTLMDIETVKYSELLGSYYTGNNAFDTASGTTLNEELYDYDTKADTDDFGRVGHVWLNAKNKVVTGLYADEADAVYTAEVKSGTIYADLGLTETTVATVIENGERLEKGFQLKKNSTTKTAWGNGTLIEAYVDDEDVTLVVIDTYLAQVDADAEDGEVDVTVFSGPIAGGTFETAVEYAEDDYVLVTIADGDIQSMVAADEVVGGLDAVASSYVRLDDTKYNLAANVADADECFTINYNTDVAVVLDNYGYAIGMYVVEEDEALDGYVLATASQIRENDLLTEEAAVVKVMYLDGTGYDVLPLPTKTENKVDKVRLATGWTTMALAADMVDNEGKSTAVAYGFYGYYMNEDGCIVLKELDDTKAVQSLNGAVKFEEAQRGYFGTLEAKNAKHMNSNTELVLVSEKEMKTATGYKNININETEVDALMLFDGSVINQIVVVDGEAVEADIYAYYDGEQHEGDKGTWLTLYVDGAAVNYLYDETVTKTYEYNNGESGDANNLLEGVYIIETEGDELISMKRVAKEDSAELVITSKALYFQTADEAKEYYHEDVKVFDMTDGGGGAEATIAKNDKVVFVLDRSSKDTGLVTYAYIVARVNKDATTNDDIVVIPDLTFTVDVNGATATVATNAENAKMNVYVYNAELGMKALIEANLTVDEFTAEATGVYTFELVVNDKPVAEIEKAIFVTAQ